MSPCEPAIILAVAVALSAAACSTSTGGQAQPVPTVTKVAGPQLVVGTLHVALPVGAKYTARQVTDGLLDGCIGEGGAVCQARLLDLREATSDPNAPINLPARSGPSAGTPARTCRRASPPPRRPGTPPWRPAATSSTPASSRSARRRPSTAAGRSPAKTTTQNNQVRMWWLPTSKILVVQYGSSRDWDEKMDTMLAARDLQRPRPARRG